MTVPTDQDWDMIVFCQQIAHAVRKSDNLRLPRDPERALKAMQKTLRPDQTPAIPTNFTPAGEAAVRVLRAVEDKMGKDDGSSAT